MSVRILGFAGLLSAGITIVAAHDPRWLVLSGVLMVGANAFALIRGTK